MDCEKVLKLDSNVREYYLHIHVAGYLGDECLEKGDGRL